jgi:transcriptional regulator GlxA family with amidase domain
MTTAALLVFPDVRALDVTGPLDVFTEANRFLHPRQHYRLEIVSTEGGRVRCSNGLAIYPHKPFFESSGQFDLLLVAGGPSVARASFDESLYRWLRVAAEQCACIGSICNGALLLAWAGLLDGRRVATHWSFAEALAHACPTARICINDAYVDEGKLVTSAGVAASIDMSLHLLARQHGAALALDVAKQLLPSNDPTRERLAFQCALTPQAASSAIVEIQQYVLANLPADLSIPVLASIANMSVRHFTRIFSRETRLSPSEFVEQARLDAARTLLESTLRPVKTIAYECGFGNAPRMRAVFQRHFGMSPQLYRTHSSSEAAADR